MATSADVVERRPKTGPPNGRSRDDRVPYIFAGLACGLVVGVMFGLLLAPKSGRDSRAWITQQGREARRRAGTLLDPSAARAIIREGGVRGLLEALRRGSAEGPRHVSTTPSIV